MSSKKVKNTVLPRFRGLALMLVYAILASCSSGIRDDFVSTSDSYNTVPYGVPRAAPPAPRAYGQPYANPYGNQQPYYYGVPNSRSYYNPYDFQQPYGRNPYSDYDQYYVPPAQYYNNENYGNEQQGKSISTFSGKS